MIEKLSADDIKTFTITADHSIREAMEIIDQNSQQVVLVVDNKKTLINTITDGDIRRALLKGANLDDKISEMGHHDPIYATADTSEDELLHLLLSNEIHHLPIVDANKTVINLVTRDVYFAKKEVQNPVVIMVGGLGKRLGELTAKTPKPMLKVGPKPILESVIENLAKTGFQNIYLCVNYLSDQIKAHFEDGKKFGIHIHYIHEDKPLGTAGALSLFRDKLDMPFIVMNGDIMTTLNLSNVLQFHTETKSDATMCVREYKTQVPFGVINTRKHRIESIIEKPVTAHVINAGIYVLDPSTLSTIPDNEFFDMPALFTKLIDDKKKVNSYNVFDYWIDIGKSQEYERANMDYDTVFDS